MKQICLYFQVHQPFRFKRYRFFDIGNDNYYYDDYSNENIMIKVAQRCYLPANKILLKLIKDLGSKFKVTFSITGIALDQFELYAPEVLDSFQKLAKTGNVEFLAETYSHSLIALKNKEEFKKQVEEHSKRIKSLFGQNPVVFRNTELIYSDEIGANVNEMGYNAILTEGAKHILGWKSPNFLYVNAINPRLKVLLKNFTLSDDIAFRFSNSSWPEYPLTPEKFAGWINDLEDKEEIINVFMDYETFGEHQGKETGIFDFLKKFPKVLLKKSNCYFTTPSEAIKELQPVSAVHVPNPISWADEERDLTAWLGNDLQNEAFNKLYSFTNRIKNCHDETLKTDWKYLQTSDHFYYMSTKMHSDGAVHAYFNPYKSPYDAFINYMNILSDFEMRLNACVPKNDKEEIEHLSRLLEEKQKQIKEYEKELQQIKKAKTQTKPKTTTPKKTGGTKKTTAQQPKKIK